MKLSLEQVEHIAELAKLELTPSEKERYREQLSDILDYADSLQALNVADVQATAHAVGMSNVMRLDLTEASYPVEDVLANAPDEEESQFRVRAILE